MDYCDCGGDTSSKYCGICHKLMDEPWCIDCGRLVYVPDHEQFCECVNNRITKFRRSARIVAQLARAGITHRRWWLRACEDIYAARAEVTRVTELAITERDSAAREIERLTAALENIAAEIDGSVGGVIARAALRQPAPAPTQEQE